MSQIDIFDEIIVDNFAGGGGASTGIELAAGRPVAIAINHDPDAILLHKTNHPYTDHLQASVWDVDPVAVCRGRPVGLAWFSPRSRVNAYEICGALSIFFAGARNSRAAPAKLKTLKKSLFLRF